MKWIKQLGIIEWVLILIAVLIIAIVVITRTKELECWEYRELPYGEIPAYCIHYVRTW